MMEYEPSVVFYTFVFGAKEADWPFKVLLKF